MLMRNTILVTGRSNVNLADFVHDLYKDSAIAEPSDTHDTSSHSDTSGSSFIPWQLVTKYYTANVNFWHKTIDTETDKGRILLEELGNKDSEIGSTTDAFVYVFEQKEDEDVCNDVAQWLPFLETHDPAIRLCIAMPGNTSADKNSRYQDWCIEHQFEFIDMGATESDVDERSGKEQVIEALQANMWDGLERKMEDTSLLNKTLRDLHLNDAEEDTLGVEEDTLVVESLPQETKPDILSNEDQDGDIHEDDDEEEEDSLELPTQEEVDRMREQLFGDIEGDDGLDKAFKAMQTMRDRGKDLPDHERKKMAAQVALSFAAQLGL